MQSKVIRGLSNADYHNGEPYAQYLSSTSLKYYLHSPKYFEYMQEHAEAREASEALRFGSLFHDLMAETAENPAEPAEALLSWVKRIEVFQPPVNEKSGKPYGTTTKAYKEAYKAFLQVAEGKLTATTDEIETLIKMRNSLLYWCGDTSAQVAKLLRWSKGTEVSFFYENADGIKLKARPDLLTKNKIIDWKTCSLDSLDEDSITRQIIRYRYDVSLAMYQYIIHEIKGKWLTPILVFVQKQSPCDAVMCDISEWCYRYDQEFDLVTPGVGAMEFARLLALHTECVKSGNWPGAESAITAEGATRIMRPKVPTYFGMKYFND